ncbi:MAG: aminopeptidase P family protein [Eubacterium sp.]|nr:aminopeptidase P family protein [Eubacterium sp.]
MKYIAGTIKTGMNLREIQALCEAYLLNHGADSFWYWDIGAFIFAGEETAVSVSGKDYKAANRVIQEHDMITIDLSPQKNHILSITLIAAD